MNDTILGLCIIALALLVAIRSHRQKLRRKEQTRQQWIKRLEPYPLDMFPREPRERYELGPLDMQIVKDLVEGKKR